MANYLFNRKKERAKEECQEKSFFINYLI